MATIRLCDWTKERLAKDETPVLVRIGEVEFEVGDKGAKLLLEQLEGEEVLGAPKVQIQEKIVFRDALPASLQVGPPGLNVEVTGDPFDTGPGSMPQPIQSDGGNEPPVTTATGADPEDEDVPPIHIPAGNKRFKTNKAQRDQVVRDSTRFEEGTLPALTVGARAQKEASAKLRAEKDNDLNELNRLSGHGIRLKNNPGL